MMINVVWFKKDLRTTDHTALVAASRADRPVLALYVVEPDLWAQPDQSARQWHFVRECLQDLEQGLGDLGLTLHYQIGEIAEVLLELHTRYGIQALYSHEESGNLWSYRRDLKVRKLCKTHHIKWHEYPQNGVVRGLKDREGWARHWEDFMGRPTQEPPLTFKGVENAPSHPLPTSDELGLPPDPCLGRQTGGRAAGWALLESFLESGRARTYNRDMSSPISAHSACSRLSPHFTYGSLSIREVTQFSRVHHAPDMTRGAFNAFMARLHWHCHFMQKLETSPEFETHTIHPAYETLHLEDHREDFFEAFITAQTGFPFIDACLRFLDQTGWINFRMRAMLTSFASYHLWLDWRKTGHFLARQFIDYEPGIHWNQIQMQSGTTGINAIRIYNPIKQSHDQDFDGDFIARWIPQLSEVPRDYIHEPWKMSLNRQQDSGCLIGQDYPNPIIDHILCAKEARHKIFKVRKTAQFKETAQAIFEKHGSRKSRPLRTKAKRERKKIAQMNLQMDLF